MKKLFITLAVVVFGISLSAQNTDDYIEVQRGVLKTEKKAIVADAMELTESESTAFWPLYNEYNDKMYVLNTKTLQLIKDYAENFESMTDEKAVELWNENMKVKDELAKLEKTYFKKFQKIIPPKKATLYFQLESKIRTLINAKLALEIPLIEE